MRALSFLNPIKLGPRKRFIFSVYVVLTCMSTLRRLLHIATNHALEQTEMSNQQIPLETLLNAVAAMESAMKTPYAQPLSNDVWHELSMAKSALKSHVMAIVAKQSAEVVAA